MAQKWIINDNTFKMSSSIDYHHQLAKDHSTTKGGGQWEVNYNNRILWLWGVSSEFGAAMPEEIVDALKQGKMSSRFDNYKVMYTTWLSEKLPDPDKFTEIHVIK